MVLRPDYPITTARLILRPYTAGDFDAVYGMRSRPDVTRYLLFAANDRDQAQESLEAKIQSQVLAEPGGNLTLAVVLAETGTVIGEVLLFWLNREHRAGEIGYLFHPDHSGQGYATEAARELLRLGFEGLGLHRIVGRLDARNTASARVLERLGMRPEAHFVQNEIIKGEWTDEVVYAILEDEWRTR